MLTKPEIEKVVLAALQAYDGEAWRAIARVEKRLAAAIAIAVSYAQEFALLVRAEGMAR
jgi:hypothetical protein